MPCYLKVFSKNKTLINVRWSDYSDLINNTLIVSPDKQ